MACKDCGFKTDLEKQAEKEGKDLSNNYHCMTMYGHCPKCTPKKYFQLISDIQDKRIDAGREWDAKFAEKRKQYIEKKAAPLVRKALKVYNAKRPADQPELTDVPSH